MNSIVLADGGEMKPIYESEQTESFRNNVVARRLANRERQRRYRERKRMEADKRKKTTPENLSTVKQQRTTIPIDSSIKKCTRDWKKDARNVVVTNPVASGRRHWKEEARNKINS